MNRREFLRAAGLGLLAAAGLGTGAALACDAGRVQVRGDYPIQHFGPYTFQRYDFHASIARGRPPFFVVLEEVGQDRGWDDTFVWQEADEEPSDER